MRDIINNDNNAAAYIHYFVNIFKYTYDEIAVFKNANKCSDKNYNFFCKKKCTYRANKGRLN